MFYLGALAIKLYRAVSEAELADILSYGRFRPCPSGCSMEGKWFAESLENALEWGKRFYASKKFHVVIATVSLEIVAKMYPREENLDGICKAIWADEEILDQIKPLEILSVSRLILQQWNFLRLNWLQSILLTAYNSALRKGRKL